MSCPAEELGTQTIQPRQYKQEQRGGSKETTAGITRGILKARTSQPPCLWLCPPRWLRAAKNCRLPWQGGTLVPYRICWHFPWSLLLLLLLVLLHPRPLLPPSATAGTRCIVGTDYRDNATIVEVIRAVAARLPHGVPALFGPG